MLSPGDQADWRRTHIPHRVRAAIARLDMQQSILQVNTLLDPDRLTPDRKVYWRCSTDSIWEGRLAATRWLIEFLGICQKSGKPARPKKLHADVQLDDFNPGSNSLFDLSKPDACLLADVWKGCSQASSHATHGSNHPPVNEASDIGHLKLEAGRQRRQRGANQRHYDAEHEHSSVGGSAQQPNLPVLTL
jgi:hypothetical protein